LHSDRMVHRRISHGLNRAGPSGTWPVRTRTTSGPCFWTAD